MRTGFTLLATVLLALIFGAHLVQSAPVPMNSSSRNSSGRSPPPIEDHDDAIDIYETPPILPSTEPGIRQTYTPPPTYNYSDGDLYRQYHRLHGAGRIVRPTETRTSGPSPPPTRALSSTSLRDPHRGEEERIMDRIAYSKEYSSNPDDPPSSAAAGEAASVPEGYRHPDRPPSPASPTHHPWPSSFSSLNLFGNRRRRGPLTPEELEEEAQRHDSE